MLKVAWQAPNHKFQAPKSQIQFEHKFHYTFNGFWCLIFGIYIPETTIDSPYGLAQNYIVWQGGVLRLFAFH